MVLLMEDPVELTDEQIEYFKHRVEYWRKWFRVVDWEVMVRSIDTDDSYAYCQGDCKSRLATICVSTTWDIEPTEKMLDKTAFHEVLELIFWEIHELGVSRWFNEDAWDQARHRVIRMMESVIWEPNNSL